MPTPPHYRYIKIYSHSGSFIREIAITSGDRIVSDGINIYVYTSSSVDIYTIEGTYVASISEDNIQSVAVKDTNIYIVTSSKVKKYNFYGVFQSEFNISGTVTDAVII